MVHTSVHVVELCADATSNANDRTSTLCVMSAVLVDVYWCNQG